MAVPELDYCILVGVEKEDCKWPEEDCKPEEKVDKVVEKDYTMEEICRLLAEVQRCKERIWFEELQQLDDVGEHVELEPVEVLQVQEVM